MIRSGAALHYAPQSTFQRKSTKRKKFLKISKQFEQAVRLFARRIDLVKYLKMKGFLKDGLLEDPRVFMEENEKEDIVFDAVPDSYLRKRTLYFGSYPEEIKIVKVIN